MNIAVIYGGKSSEHEVSLVSAASIVRTLEKTHTVYLIGITKTGCWFLQPEKTLNAVRETESSTLSIAENENTRVLVAPGGGTSHSFFVNGHPLSIDVVFPVLHGSFGEDGTIQGLLEMAEIPYVGGGVLASSASMDKEKTKIIWQHAGLPVVPFLCAKKAQWDNDDYRIHITAKAEKEWEYPLFAKPCRAGSSIGAGVAANHKELIHRIEQAFQWDSKILIEPCIEAREIECSITGNDECTVYIPGEIIPSHAFYDYNAKYTDPDGAILKIPADIDDEQRRTIRAIAAKAYQALDLTGLARVDFFIEKKSQAIFLNEVNTIPGFTAISMFPKMCAASGLSYQKLIMLLFDLAIERFNQSRLLKTDTTP